MAKSGSERRFVKKEPSSKLRRFENYEVMLDEEGQPIELGRGAMGVIYKALDVDLRCPVTLKLISEKYVGNQSARLQFLQEARAAASLRHPNVALSYTWAERRAVTSTRWSLEGETLGKLIRRSGRLEVKLALEIATQVAAGLASVHKQKLVHRDIKPSNVMVSLEEGNGVTAKIIDLGLAKTVSEEGAQSAISTLEAFAGTPALCQSGTFCDRRCGHPFGSILTGCRALANVDRPSAIPGFSRRGDVSASARAVTPRRTRNCPAGGGCSTGGPARERSQSRDACAIPPSRHF
jgi:Protein kinase domain